MKIKLIDHSTKTEEATWGTCDLCEYTAPFDFTELKFQADDGSEAYWVEAWEYMPYDGPEGPVIDNLYDFAHYIGTLEFTDGTVIDFVLLVALVDDYQKWREEQEG